jgi:hypothetical protein
MKKKVFFLLSFILLFACSEEKKMRKLEVFEIREIGELSSTEYVYSKVLKIDDKGEWYKFGDRKLLISCKAKVKAGIDFTLIQKEDIVVKGNNISITLPKPKITSFNMDPNSIKTEMADVSGMRFSFSQEEKNKILQMGEKSIREALTETGIYKEAQKNAISFVKEFYQQLGFENITVEIKGDDEK